MPNDAPLSDRVEKAANGSFALDCEIARAVGSGCVNPPLGYTVSLDAAMSLVPEGWNRSFSDDPDDLGGVIGELWTSKENAWANAATPALALCAAALKARGL